MVPNSHSLLLFWCWSHRRLFITSMSTFDNMRNSWPLKKGVPCNVQSIQISPPVCSLPFQIFSYLTLFLLPLPVFSDGLFLFKPPLVLVSSNHRILHNWFAKILSFAIPLARTLLLKIMKAERRAQIGITKGFDGTLPRRIDRL